MTCPKLMYSSEINQYRFDFAGHLVGVRVGIMSEENIYVNAFQ